MSSTYFYSCKSWEIKSSIFVLFQWFLSQDLTAIVDVRCEAGSLLSDIYGEENRIPESKQILLKAMEMSQTNQYWHCKLLFQAAVSFLCIGMLSYMSFGSTKHTLNLLNVIRNFCEDLLELQFCSVCSFFLCLSLNQC